MTKKILKVTLATAFVALLISTQASAQIIEFPISPGQPTREMRIPSGQRMATLQTLLLPFWDDFSYTDTLTYPDENKWQFGQSVHLNHGTGYRPPSKNVVTLDGVDSLGKPYNVNDILAKGVADRLVSQNLRLDLVDPALRNTVYLSFYFQLKGNGEIPDAGDQLQVDFKADDGKWENVYIIDSDGTQDPLVFYQALLPITDTKFYHDAFQFRIQNKARLSGPYDTWNIDYVYLNSGRSSTDTSYPDRTISTSFTSFFGTYFSMPARHFLTDPDSYLVHPVIGLYNLAVGNTQPFDYTTTTRIVSRKAGVVTESIVPLDVAQDPGSLLIALQYFELTLNLIPTAADFDPLADSIGIELKYGMSTDDNRLISAGGDYDPARYSPINFKTNDSLRTTYTLASYYAYDDGGAEYGAGLNQAGSYLAFEYDLQGVPGDTLVYVDIYFPEFGDNTAQTLLLQIRSKLDDALSSILHQETIQVDRRTQNKFVRYPLLQPVTVGQRFYVSWKQTTNASIPVGLDKNHDTGDKVYYNTNGVWVQNTTVHGSMMVRPGFGPGKGSGPVTGIESSRAPAVYPNPCVGYCYLPEGAREIVAYDLRGSVIPLEINSGWGATQIRFPAHVNGLAIVQYQLNGTLIRSKLVVQAP